MSAYVSSRTIDVMNRKGVMVKDADILILGLTFKENCPDLRNTKVIGIYNTFMEYTPNVEIFDNWADPEEARRDFNINLIQGDTDPLKGKFDAVVLAVAHDDFANLSIKSFLKDPQQGVVFDVKGVMPTDLIDGRL